MKDLLKKYSAVSNKGVYRVFAGKGSAYHAQCIEHGFIGIKFPIYDDLSHILQHDKAVCIDYLKGEYVKVYKDKSLIAAGIAANMLYTVLKTADIGDLIMCPDGNGSYSIGKLNSNYEFNSGYDLFHVRKVLWLGLKIHKSELPEQVYNSARAIGTVSNLTKYSSIIENIIENKLQE